MNNRPKSAIFATEYGLSVARSGGMTMRIGMVDALMQLSMTIVALMDNLSGEITK